MALADYCMDPGPNTVKLAPHNIDVYVRYYVECPGGSNPIESELSAALTAISVARRTAQGLLRFICRKDRPLKAAFEQMNNIQDSLESIKRTAACRPTQEAFAEATHDGFCGGVYKGIWVIWLAIFVGAAVLLLGLIFSTCLYPYFTRRAKNKANAQSADTQSVYATAPLTEL
jgi:hypothetical protein